MDNTFGLYSLGEVPLGGLANADSGITATELRRFASEHYVTKPTDALANEWFDGRLSQPLRLRNSVIGARTPVGALARGEATVVLLNGDGVLDPFLTQLGVAGREITVRSLRRGASHDTAVLLFRGVMEPPSGDLDQVTINAAGRDRRLRQRLNDTFAGTGGVEGGADRKGQQKPVVVGEAHGVPPVDLGLIGGLPSFLVAGGKSLPINDVTGAFDQAETLNKVGGTPAAGEYAIDTATGVLTTGAVPAFLTCNVQGYAPGGVWKQTVADVIEALLVDFGGVPNARLDGYAFQTLNQELSGVVGWWFGPDQDVSVRGAVEVFTRGITAWAGFGRRDVFRIGRLKAPGGAIRNVFDDTNIEDIAPVDGPTVMNPTAWIHEVGYERNFAVTRRFSASSTPEQRQFMESQWRVESASDGDIQARFPDSQPFFTEGVFRDSADALALAQHQVAVYKDRNLWRVRSGPVPAELDFGDTVLIDDARFGFDDTPATVLEYDGDTNADAVETVVFA